MVTHTSTFIHILLSTWVFFLFVPGGNEVLVCGKRVPVLGTVCMDQCVVDLDSVPEAKVGDQVVVFGRQVYQCLPTAVCPYYPDTNTHIDLYIYDNGNGAIE